MGLKNFIVNLAPSPLVKLFAGPYVAGDSIVLARASALSARDFTIPERLAPDGLPFRTSGAVGRVPCRDRTIIPQQRPSLFL